VSARRILLCLFITLLGRVVPLQAQDGADVIRGRVLGPDKQPIANVTVTATAMSDQTSRTAKTNKDGRFTIVFDGGGGDYLMSYTAIGLAPNRFEIKREVDEDVLVADATMSAAAVVLDAIRTTGRQRVDPNRPEQEIGGHEQSINMNNVSIDAQGDLAAMAASLPGVSLIPGADGAADGFSVLGLGADQNNVTLNGLDFSGSDLPRDATTQTRVATSTFDPSRGGFSGAQITLRSQRGSNYEQRTLHATVDAPSLQYTDAIGRQLGQQYSNLQISGNASGPIRLDKAFYALSYQFGRRSSDLQTLLNTDPAALERVGVSADSAARLQNLLTAAGIPWTTGAIPGSRLNQNGSLLGSLNFAPSGTHSFEITGNARWSGIGGSNLSTTAVPAHGGQSSNWGGALQARHSSYFGNGFLDETNAAVSNSRSAGDAYLVLPSANVLVNSDFADGSAGVSTLQFGGNAGYPRSSNSWTSEVANTMSWISLNNKHRFKLYTDARFNSYEQSNTNNALGTFSYNSLADFASGTPASFTRRLNVNTRSGKNVAFSASLGDSYRRTPRLQLTYGLRMDVSRFAGNPTENPAIEQTFNVPNDNVPRGVYLSPRFGFSWTYGTSPQIQGFQGAFRGSRGQVHGGIGQFQNLPNSQLIAAAVDNTGLPTGAQQISCVGGAIPTPDWTAYLQDQTAIPTTCTDGSSGSVFSSSVPNVSLFSPDYVPQRSWRANLGWAAPILNNTFRGSVDGTYSLNLNQQGTIDLNFDRQARFTLAGEGGRPVFVNPTSIVPGSGAIVSRDARITQQYAQVTDYRSDMQSRSAQLQLGISPVSFNSSLQWSLTYVLQHVSDLSRGFNGTTAGDPYLTQWARSNSDARHQFNLSLGYTIKQAVSITTFTRVQSGTPFTPMVAGDVNGDGYNNDRAFVFDPANAANPALGAAMQNLLTNGSSAVRDCLRSQLGSVAGRNSCEGPWTTNMSLRVSLVSQALGLPQRATISLGVANPLTGIDALVHGSDNMHGWGGSAFTDPTLLYVRGFTGDSAYVYDVNPRFGASRESAALNRAPMRLTLDVRYDVGPERERQQLILGLRAGRGGKGQKMTERQIRMRYTRSYPNPFEQMLRQHDSLGLSQQVSDSIAILNKNYSNVIDSIWSPVAKYLANLPAKYDEDEAYARVRAAENKSLDQMAVYGPAAKHLLTDEQVRKLPAFIALFLDQKALRQVRPGFAGGGRGGFFGPGE
jgi:hypothetical protein